MERGLISVDRWTEWSQAYFLTHLHSDHTQGLSATWSKGPLFCSRTTAKLFPLKFPNFNLNLLRVLDTASWHALSLVSYSSGSKTLVHVMPIDAHHCPGAVMFLFRGDFGCLLFTGDFRWEACSERAEIGRTTLLNALQDNAVDILYVDNTYCNPSYEFPSREVAAKKVADIIASHPEHDVIIGIDTLGKEELLLQISRLLNTKIWVWPERLQTMHLLGFHDTFTTKTSLTRVRAVPRYSFSLDTLKKLNTMRPTIGIMPSGLPWVVKPTKGDDKLFGSLLTSSYNRGQMSGDGLFKTDQQDKNLVSVEKYHEYAYSVPYSDHSCFSEIHEFIKLVQPSNMKGIVSLSTCYVDPMYYFGRLCESRKHRINEGDELDETVQVKSCFGTNKFTEVKRKRKTQSKIVNKVIAIRRVQRGAKLRETDLSD